jgi:transcriptional regulator with XRE-family HTH domain
MITDNPIHEIESRAREAGISLNKLCEEAGVARSTPVRWKRAKNGNSPTLSVVRKLEGALERLISKAKH